MNIIFMGTPEFAVPSLEKLHYLFGVKAVVTVPDKEQGRGRKVKFSPVKEKALELGIDVLQPEKLKDTEFIERIKSYNPDIICVIAFRILPEEVYSLAKIASFNIHGSLLPKFRGAAPINRAIMAGESKTGLTSFILKKVVDTGDILLRTEIEIYENMTAGELHDALMPMAAGLTVDTIKLLEKGNYTLLNQNDEEATPAPKIFRDECKLDVNYNVIKAKNHIHGLSPYPAAFIVIEDIEIKLLRVEFSDKLIIKGCYLIDKEFLIGVEGGTLKVLELKPQGKSEMKVNDFINGWRKDKTGILS